MRLLIAIGCVAIAIGQWACGDAVGDPEPDAAGVANLVADTSELEFPDVAIGTSGTQAVRLSNNGSAASGVVAATFSGDGAAAYSTEGCDAPIEPGAYCDLDVIFAPLLGGPAPATMTVSAQPGNELSIAVIGEEAHNLAFVSSAEFPANLGGVAAYDTKCNELADAAGLLNPGGNSYVAWMSDSTSDAVDRLGGARGFVRVDGVPFADLVQSNVIFNPLEVDENGVRVSHTTDVFTGTTATGVVNTDMHCDDWSSVSGPSWSGGQAAYGPSWWAASDTATGACQASTNLRIYCLMTTKNIPLTAPPPPVGAKLIYLTPPYVPGVGGTPDQRCTASKPSGFVLGNVKALISTQTIPAGNHLIDEVHYVRVDGSIVGTGAELKTGSRFRAHVWQDGAGNYLDTFAYAWTGSTSPGELGDSAASTCGNWSNSGAGDGRATQLLYAGDGWSAALTQDCAEALHLICIEE